MMADKRKADIESAVDDVLGGAPEAKPKVKPKTKPGKVKTTGKHSRTPGGLIRLSCYLTDAEWLALDERAEREVTSKSNLIRQAVRAYLGL